MNFTVKECLKDTENRIKRIKTEMENCTICNGTGKIGVREIDTGIKDDNGKSTMIMLAIPCNCSIDRERNTDIKDLKIYRDFLTQIVRDASFPEEYGDPTLANVSFKEKMLVFLSEPSKMFLWLEGGVGTGKTYAAYAIMNYVLASNQDNFSERCKAVMIREYEILERMQEKTESELFKTRNILIIDDVMVTTNQWKQKDLLDFYYKLADFRRLNRLKTVFTSNLTLSEWNEAILKTDSALQARIASRMSNVSMKITLSGADQRQLAYKV